MIIGIWLTKCILPTIGGGSSYYDVMIENIDKKEFKDVEIAFISNNGPIHGFNKKVILIPFYRKFLFKLFKSISFLIPVFFKYKYSCFYENIIGKYLQKKGVQIIFYPTQGYAYITNFPFISNNWDIGHKSTYAFPEFFEKNQFNIRNKWYDYYLKKALMVFSESEAGKQELIRFTGIAEEKVKVLPIFAGRSILKDIDEENQKTILEKYDLKNNQYFFYPAQFWAHKNHYGLLQAFARFLKRNKNYKLILTGSDQGNLKYIKNQVNLLKLEQNVVFGGFVNTDEICTFYRNAIALVMTTFFGPTNMPLLEALALDCPVLCTDLPGHREIMSDAALYFKPGNYDEIAECMEKILDRNNREKLIANAAIVKRESKFIIQNTITKMEKYFLEIKNVRKCWEQNNW